MPDSDYSWLDDPMRCPVAVAACITAITGSSTDEVLAAFGADPAAPTLASEQAAFGPEPTVATITVPGGVLAVENNGWQGSRPEVLQPLSSRGRAASIYWNVNALTRISGAEAGLLVGAFDPVSPDQPVGDDPDRLAAVLAGLDFSAGDWVAQGMVVVERFTGVAITPDIVTSIERVHVLTPVLDDLRPHAAPTFHALRWVDPDLLAAVAGQPRDTLRRLARWSATEAVAAAGLDQESALSAVLQAFAEGQDRSLGADAAALVRELEAEANRAGHRDSAGANPATRDAWRRAAAARALRAATNQDPLTAALDSLDAARLAFPELGVEFLRQARHRLANSE